MPDIFINYRTNDEEASASLIDKELRDRFGPKQVFRASRSIKLGEDYVRKLLDAVRDSKVLLAVIGSRWLTAVDEQGRNRLHNEADWTRKEILEAFEHGVAVIPVLVGSAERLRPSDLPPELARLVNCQYHKLNHRSSDADLRNLGDRLAELVPSLAASDQLEDAAESDTDDGRGSATLRAGDHARQQVGGPHTVVNHPHGQMHTGSGHQFNSDNVNYLTGGNSGGIRQKFGSTRQQPDDKR